MEYAMRKHEPIFSGDTKIFVVNEKLQVVSCLHQESLARIRLSQECIRRSDAMLAELASVLVTGVSEPAQEPLMRSFPRLS